MATTKTPTSRFDTAFTQTMSASQALAIVGGLVAAKATFDLLNFVYFHTRSSRVTRYLHGKAPYALVTGATDGIGKSTAKELYRRGFNLIIHGRNAEKLERVRKEIIAVGGAGKDVKVWVADAGSPDVDFDGAVKSWDELEITLVLHNVGGAPSRGVQYVLCSLIHRLSVLTLRVASTRYRQMPSSETCAGTRYSPCF